MAIGPKNVILITIDSLRADHLSCLGYHKNTTPNLDNLAEEGVLFTNAISCGTDTPTSMAPLLTSTYVLTHFVMKGGLDKLRNKIEKKADKLKNRLEEFKIISAVTFEIYKNKTTIAKILKDRGYATAAFHSNPFLSRYFNLDKEFDYFYDSFSYLGGSRKYKIRIREILEKNIRVYTIIKYLYNKLLIDNTPYDRAEIINEKVITWLKNQKSNFFVWIHYMDVHFPYKPLKKFQRYFRSKPMSNLEMSIINYKMTHKPNEISEDEVNDIIDLYDGEIKYVDHAIKLLLHELGKMNILNSTLIIITSDHGDEFRDHGNFVHDAKLYDELIRVPLIIYNSTYKNIKIEDPVSLLDVSPTILDLFGIPSPESFQGRSLIPIIRGERKSLGVISECIGKEKLKISYRTKDWKYIIDEIAGKYELYNLKIDPKEVNNVYKEEREKAKELELKIREHISKQEKIIKRLKNEKERTKKRIIELKKAWQEIKLKT